MRLVIEIDLDNAGTADPMDVAKVLARVSERIAGWELSGRCVDVNGNGVGTFEIRED